MVNIDDWAGRLLAKIVGQNLHVSGEHGEINGLLAHDRENALLCSAFACRLDVKVLEGYAMLVC